MVREGDAALTAAVGLAEANLRKMRPGDLLNLWETIKPLALHDGSYEALFLYPTDGTQPNPKTVKEWLLALQKGIRRLLEQIAEVRNGSRQEIKFTGVVALTPPDTGRPTFHSFKLTLEPTGNDYKKRFVRVVVLEMLNRFTRADLERLRQCDVCERWFWAGRRLDQVYDSQTCLMKARWQRDKKRR